MKSLSRWITQPASATAGACQRASKIKLGLGLICYNPCLGPEHRLYDMLVAEASQDCLRLALLSVGLSSLCV